MVHRNKSFRRACLFGSVAGLALGTQPALAQDVTPQVPLSDFCTPQSGSFCTDPVKGTRSIKIIKPAVVTSVPGGQRFVGESEITFDGQLQVDGAALDGSGVFPSLLLPAFNDQLNVQVSTNYNVAYDGTDYFFGPGQIIYDPSTKFTVNSLVTKSIGVDLKSDAFTFADGSVGKLRLAAIDPTAIVNDATVLSGKYSSTDGKIVYGTISGQARIVKNPAPIALGNPSGGTSEFLSPFALALDVTSTVQTQLDETGLITPKIAVSQGIEMNGSKITGLAAGTQANDAVNFSQLQAEASQRAALGTALQTETAARTAGDQALANQLQVEAARRAALAAALREENVARTTADQVLAGQLQNESAVRAAADQTLTRQIQSEAAKRAALGESLLEETRARVAGDMALSNQLGALESRVSSLTSRIDRQDAKIASSTAIAVAMGGAVFLPGMKYNLTANVGTYQGAHAGSIQIGALVSPHVAVNAGVATGFNKGGKTAGRVGFTLGW